MNATKNSAVQTSKNQNHEQKPDQTEIGAQHPKSGIQNELLDLQGVAGNQAIIESMQNIQTLPTDSVADFNLSSLTNRLTNTADAKGLPAIVRSTLMNSGGQPLDPDLRSTMETRLGYDLGIVRLHTDPNAAQSASEVNANAYTVGRDIVFGHGNYQPNTSQGRQLIIHELAHVIQQNRGGAPPQANPNGIQEQGANVVASTLGTYQGPATVGGGTGIGLARQFASRNLADLSDSELRNEFALVNGRLSEPVSYSGRDADELYLKDIMSQMGLRGIAQSKAPEAEKTPKKQIRQRQHRKKVRPGGGDKNDLLSSVSTIESIRPSQFASGIYTMMYLGEQIEITEADRQKIIAKTTKGISKGLDGIKSKSDRALSRYRYQKKVDDDHPIVSRVVQFVGGVDDPGLSLTIFASQSEVASISGKALLQKGQFRSAAQALIRGERAAKRADLLSRAFVKEIISTGEKSIKVLEITRDTSFSIAIGIGAVVAAPVVAGGAAAAAGGVGLTGAAATATTVVGTGAVVTGGGAVAGGTLRGGSNLVGQALTGDPIDLDEVKQEAATGAKRGAVDAATSVVTAGTGTALGQGATLTGRVAKGAASGFTGGAAGGGLQAGLEGKSAGEIIESAGQGGLSGAIGGGLGGPVSGATAAKSKATKFLAGSATGAVGSGASTLATGGSLEDVKNAAITGGLTGGVTSLAAPPSRSLQKGQTRDNSSKPQSQDVPPSEIIGEPIRIPSPSGPVLRPDGQSAQGSPFRRPPKILDSSGRPIRRSKSRQRPKLFGANNQQVIPRKRSQRPTLFGPDERPIDLPGKGRRRGNAASKSSNQGRPPMREMPVILDQRGVPIQEQPSAPQLVDSSGTNVVSGARVKLQPPLELSEPLPAGDTRRGQVVEPQVIRQRYPGARTLPPYFEGFDAIQGGQRTPVFAGQRRGALRTGERFEGGRAISIKSVRVDGSSYQDRKGMFNGLKKYVDAAADFPRRGPSLSERHEGQPHQVTLVKPSERVLHLEMTGNLSPIQMEGLALLKKYALDRGIQLEIVSPQSSPNAQ